MHRRYCAALILGLVFAVPVLADDAVKGAAKDMLIGKWKLVHPTLKQTVEFTKEGNMKVTTGQVEVDGKLVPLEKDGKPIDLTLEGTYEFTTDNTIATKLSNPFPETDKKPLTGRWQNVKVSKDVLTYTEGEGKERKYERAK